jgi:serine/threonine protein kinase
VAPSLINPALPGSIDAIIRQALAKDPKERFQTCEAMRNAFLEQAALLNIRPAASVPAGTAVAKPAPRPPDAYAHYLLEDNAPHRSTRTWPRTAVGLMVALIGATSWVFYTLSHTNSFPPLVTKLGSAVHRTLQRQPLNSVRPEESAGQPHTSESDQTNQNSTVHESPRAATSSSMQASGAPNNAEEAQTKTGSESSGTSTASSQEPALAQSSSSQPSSDGARTSAPATSAPAEPEQMQAPQSSSASGQPAITSAPAVVRRTDEDQPAAESASGPYVPARNGDSTKVPVTSSTDESQTDAPASATKTRRKPGGKAALLVDGFSRRDVPELLRQADAAAGRGDYRLASYEYKLILKLDRSNTMARLGLHRVQSAEQPH